MQWWQAMAVPEGADGRLPFPFGGGTEIEEVPS